MSRSPGRWGPTRGLKVGDGDRSIGRLADDFETNPLNTQWWTAVNSAGVTGAQAGGLYTFTTTASFIPYFRAAATARGTSGTASITIPASTQTGDAMFLLVVWKQAIGTPLVDPSGWTQVAAPTAGVGATFQGAIYRRTAIVTDPGTAVTVNPGGAAQQIESVMVVYGQCNPVPSDFGFANQGGTQATTATAAAETSGANDLILLMGVGRGAANGPAGSPSFSAPSGYVVRGQSTAQSGAAQNVGAVIMEGTATGAQALTADQTTWWITGQVVLSPL